MTTSQATRWKTWTKKSAIKRIRSIRALQMYLDSDIAIMGRLEDERIWLDVVSENLPEKFTSADVARALRKRYSCEMPFTREEYSHRPCVYAAIGVVVALSPTHAVENWLEYLDFEAASRGREAAADLSLYYQSRNGTTADEDTDDAMKDFLRANGESFR